MEKKKTGEALKKKQHMLKIVNSVVISIFAILVLGIIIFNAIYIAYKNNNPKKDEINFAYNDGYYYVQVNSTAWSSFYDIFSLIKVKEKQIDHDYLVAKDQEKILNGIELDDYSYDDVYLVRYEKEDDVYYTVGIVATKTTDGVYFIGGQFYAYSDIVGVVTKETKLVALFGNKFFVIIVICLIVLYLCAFIWFSYSKFGYDVTYEKAKQKMLNKEQDFEKFCRWQAGHYYDDKTKEHALAEFVGYVISDFNSEKVDKTISNQSVIKALQVADRSKIDTEADAFQYLSALLLIKAYSKSAYAIASLKNKKIYSSYVYALVEYIEEVKPQYVKVYVQNKNYVFECLDMQFLFDAKIKHQLESKILCEMDLEPYAEQLFYLFYDKDGCENKDVSDERINEIITELKNVK